MLFSNGGLDANWLAGKHGVPTVTFGAGQDEIHTVKEYVDLPEFGRGCRLAVADGKTRLSGPARCVTFPPGPQKDPRHDRGPSRRLRPRAAHGARRRLRRPARRASPSR